MTEIFALLWLADVVNVLQSLAVLALLVAGIFYGVGVLVAMTDGGTEVIIGVWKSTRWWLLFVALVLTLPSSASIKLLAASKVGDALLTTNTGVKTVEAVNAVLDRIIKEAEKK